MILLDELAGRDSCFLIINRACGHREIKQETQTGKKEGQTKESVTENPKDKFPTLRQIYYHIWGSQVAKLGSRAAVQKLQ